MSFYNMIFGYIDEEGRIAVYTRGGGGERVWISEQEGGGGGDE